MLNNQTRKQTQGGNVLFLILIAVALFAALSYVVTQSTRSGGGSTEREKAVLSSAQMTQYPTALRTSIIRMILSGVTVENVKFDPPASSGPFVTLSSSQLVFHPQGGGATYQDAPADLSATGNSTVTWTYNASMDIPGVGTDGVGGNDLIAFLPGISGTVCKQLNDKLSISTTGCTLAAGTLAPNMTGVNALVDAQDTQASAYTFPNTNQTDLAPTGCTTVFNRQASGCFWDVTGSRYVFYSVLLER